MIETEHYANRGVMAETPPDGAGRIGASAGALQPSGSEEIPEDPALAWLSPDRPGMGGDPLWRAARIPMPEAVLSALATAAQTPELPVDAVLSAAWAIVMQRLTGQAEVLLGVHGDSRSTALVQLRVDPQDKVSDVLARAAAAVRQGGAAREGRTGRHQCSVGWASQASGFPHDAAELALTYGAREAEGGETGLRIDYDSALFDAVSVQRLAAWHLQVVQTLVYRPAARVHELPLSSQEERRRIVGHFSRPQGVGNDEGDGGLIDEALLHTLFEAQVARTPDATALVADDGALSFVELNRRANLIAAFLSGHGVGPDVTVALCLERRTSMIAALLGVLKAGGAYVPLDTLSPAARLRDVVKDSGAAAIVCGAERQADLEPLALPLLVLGESWPPASLLALPQENSNPVTKGLTPRHLAYVIYTSGSTGKPKGVMIEHRSIVNFWRVMAGSTHAGLAPGSRIAVNASYCFDMSLKGILQLLGGHCLHLVPQSIRASGADTLHYLKAHRIDAFDCTPSQLQGLVEAGLLEDESYAPQRVLLGGEPIPDPLWQLLRGTRHIDFFNMYGPTECTVDATLGRIRDLGEQASVGRPISRCAVYILDSAGQVAPVGMPGEIHVAGLGLARGYLGQPELTRERFVTHAIDGRGPVRLYRTGDLARWTDTGTAEFLGRNDHQVKIRGFRIELGEIERVLMSHGGIRSAIVLPCATGAASPRLVAYVVPAAVTDTEADERIVSDWTGVFDEQIDDARGEDREANFDHRGWNSSYTRQPLPPEEISEWLEATLRRIRALRPRRVLEVGSGTGMILTNIAPATERYDGVDLSPRSVELVDARIRSDAVLSAKASVRLGDALRIEDMGRDYDTVVLNSVVQYFPSAAYLQRVIALAITRMSGAGRVFIGDVRNHALDDVFHLSVLLHQLDARTSVRELLRRLSQRRMADRELTLAPQWFQALREVFPQITGVRVMQRTGTHLNEMTLYRYDAVLTIGEPAEAVTARSAEEEAAHELVNQRLALEFDVLARLGQANPDADISAFQAAMLGAGRGASGVVGVHAAATRRSTTDKRIALHSEPQRAARLLGLPVMLREHAAASLPDYMVPSAFVAVETLPLNRNGKVDLKALPVPELEAFASRDYVAPIGTSERLVARIWQEVLGLERVGRQDDFFALGGHSLLAVQVIARLRKIQTVEDGTFLGVDLPLKAIFDHSSLEALARAVDGHVQVKQKAIRRVDRDGPLMPSWGQQRMWMLSELDPSANAAYNLPVCLRLRGPLDVAALEWAFDRIIERHEALRTTFSDQDGIPFLQLRATGGFSLAQEDMRGMPEVTSQAARRIAEAARRPFDLSTGPLIRGHLWRLGECESLLMVNQHHVVSDAWSAGLFFEELGQLYASRVQDGERTLAPLQVQYADYAAWQREWLSGDTLKHRIDFWRRHLSGAPALHALPLDGPRPERQSFAGGSVPLAFSPALSGALRRFSKERGVTLFMTLILGWSLTMARLSGQRDVVVGTPVANRLHAEVESLIGFFANTLAIRIKLLEPLTVEELLAQVKASVLECFANQDMPFEQVVSALNPRRSLAFNPVFQVMLTIINAPTATALRLPGVRVEPVEVPSFGTHFDLTFWIHDDGESALRGDLNHAVDIFSRESAASLVVEFERMLTDIVMNPRRRIGRLLTASSARPVHPADAVPSNYSSRSES